MKINMRSKANLGLLALSISIFSSSAIADSEWVLSKIKSKISDKISDYKESKQAEGELAEVHVIAKRHDSRSVDLDYGFYKVNYSCEHRGYNYLKYTTVKDSGKIKRYEPFHKEPELEKLNCPSQKTTNSYKKQYGQKQYHRGHGTHQNIWDHNLNYMKATNLMVNVVPHNGVQNASGLWRNLEKRVECARDVTEVTVYLGNDWGNDTSNDLFVKTHGVTTPDFLWRVHTYKSHPNQAFAWYIPNDEIAKSSDSKAYRVTLNELRDKTADDFDWPIPASWNDAKTIDPYTKTRCSYQ